MKNTTLLLPEAAKFLRVRTSTVRVLARNGKLPAFKVGRIWRIDAAEFEAYRKGTPPATDKGGR